MVRMVKLFVHHLASQMMKQFLIKTLLVDVSRFRSEVGSIVYNVTYTLCKLLLTDKHISVYLYDANNETDTENLVIVMRGFQGEWPCVWRSLTLWRKTRYSTIERGTTILFVCFPKTDEMNTTTSWATSCICIKVGGRRGGGIWLN